MVVALFRCSNDVEVLVGWCGASYVIITKVGLYRDYYTIRTFWLEEVSPLVNYMCACASVGV